MLAKKVGDALGTLKWVGIPFAGGMPELLHIKARTIVANDRHRHIINLAWTAAHSRLGPRLYRRLRREAFHPDTLRMAQNRCCERQRGIEENSEYREQLSDEERLEWACDYFVCAWMARNGKAGADDEFKASLAVRWNAGGGDSAKRFSNAAICLRDWNRILAHTTFTTLDCFQFLDKCQDREGHGIYVDAPWPDDGHPYRHGFTEGQQRRLADQLNNYVETRIVIRYGDHPLIRKLYPKGRWNWHKSTGRNAGNRLKKEVLIVNGRRR
jgi:site-specific DNA-adenine methylase